VGGVSVNAVDINQKNAAVLYGGAQYILAPYATFARDVLKAKSAALVYSEGPGTELPAAGQASAFTTAGIPIKSVSYAADAGDLTIPLQAAGATTADVVMPVINPNDCVKFEQAIQQLGIPDDKVLASPICLTPTTIEGLGDFPKWIYAIASSQTFDVGDPAVPPYQQILKDQGQDKLIGDPWVNVGFGQVLTLAKWLNAAGADNLTPDAIVEQMHAFNGPLVLGSPVIKCGKYPEAPGVCNDHTQFYKWNGNGNPMTKAGDWVPPPDGWVAPN
jgi:branched-chain amino acid transport system substrate-binding protein